MNDNYNPRADLRYAEASKRWATLGMMLLAGIACYLLYLFVVTYYGDDGVRIFGVVVGILVLVLIVIGVGFAVNAIAGGLFMRYFLGVLTGMVRFQEADDRGEIARSLVSVAKVDKQQERDILRIAGALGRGQANALVQAQRGDDRRALMEQRANEIDAFYNTNPQFDVDADRIPEGW